MISLFKVHMPPGVEGKISRTLRSGYVTEGPKVREFEQRMAEYLGNRRVAAVNSCTSGLTLSLLAAGVAAGDEVITTPMTCMATNIPIHTIGARIVWADVDPSTGNIDPESVERKVTERTKAISYVHWAGQPADIDRISAVAAKHGLKVVEDAAHAIGAEYDGRKIGNHGDFVCFSFQAIKHITTGDGGMVAFNNDGAQDNLDQLVKMRWYGLDRNFDRSVTKWHTDIVDIGFKMNMNDIAATLGVAQMDHVDTVIAAHRRHSEYYDRELDGIDGITLIKRNPWSKTAAWIYTLLLDNEAERERFAAHLKNSDIACNVVHVRNDKYSVFDQYRTELPGVDEFCSRMINIPCGWWLSQDDLETVVRAIGKGW